MPEGGDINQTSPTPIQDGQSSETPQKRNKSKFILLGFLIFLVVIVPSSVLAGWLTTTILESIKYGDEGLGRVSAGLIYGPLIGIVLSLILSTLLPIWLYKDSRKENLVNILLGLALVLIIGQISLTAYLMFNGQKAIEIQKQKDQEIFQKDQERLRLETP